MTKSIQTVLFIFALLISAALALPALQPSQATAQSGNQGNLRGYVKVKNVDLAVVGAHISIDDLGLSTNSDSSGRFEWSNLILTAEMQPVTVRVNAEGFGEWVIEDLRLMANDTVILNVELSTEPFHMLIPPLGQPRPEIMNAMPMGAMADGPMADQSNEPLPDIIRVAITDSYDCDINASYTIEEIDFNYYVKHVMPNEWGAPWPWESYRAGAMAIKMYAWAYIADGGKWHMRDPPFDVMNSTCDQVYNPVYELESMNKAVDFTWNWRLLDGDQLFHTFYRAYFSQCPSELIGACMGQYESRDMAINGYTWDEILKYFYTAGVLTPVWDPPGGYSLRYYGYGYADQNRVKIQIDDPANSDPGPPADLGATDFTIEFWLKAVSGENAETDVVCGDGDGWREGNILLDRDRKNAGRDFGLSLSGNKLAFGAADGSTATTICGTTSVADESWHHIALMRRAADGYLWIYIDGVLDAEGDGPDGDISYPDDAIPGNYCGPGDDLPCTNSDPYLVIGAEKHDDDYGVLMSFSGWLTEMRLSTALRYTEAFTRPATRFTPDADSAGLYAFYEGYGNIIHDTSAAAGGPSNGQRVYGGDPNGPEWMTDSPWYEAPPGPPIFEDVPSDHWAFTYIEAIYTAGYISGCQSEPIRLYCPDSTMIRGESAVFVERGVHGGGYMPPDPTEYIFGDTPEGIWYSPWAVALYNDGYTAGCSADPLLYCPESTHNRAEGTVFYLRMLYGSDYLPPEATELVFSDVPSGVWYTNWIYAAYTAGIALPCQTEPELLYCPEEPLKRDVAAYMMVQAKGGLPLP